MVGEVVCLYFLDRRVVVMLELRRWVEYSLSVMKVKLHLETALVRPPFSISWQRSSVAPGRTERGCERGAIR